ncbi:uncharacterized protein LOC131930572 [Physella acuta]|uniref:uncharacterized protein LOC131930572 n=1 Tax=Physella acuta TaxID=109671 RepID=UPI0027DC377A|nr:uncharacterized protein LOC131930572 [Physella acuta]
MPTVTASKPRVAGERVFSKADCGCIEVNPDPTQPDLTSQTFKQKASSALNVVPETVADSVSAFIKGADRLLHVDLVEPRGTNLQARVAGDRKNASDSPGNVTTTTDFKTTPIQTTPTSTSQTNSDRSLTSQVKSSTTWSSQATVDQTVTSQVTIDETVTSQITIDDIVTSQSTNYITVTPQAGTRPTTSSLATHDPPTTTTSTTFNSTTTFRQPFLNATTNSTNTSSTNTSNTNITNATDQTTSNHQQTSTNVTPPPVPPAWHQDPRLADPGNASSWSGGPDANTIRPYDSFNLTAQNSTQTQQTQPAINCGAEVNITGMTSAGSVTGEGAFGSLYVGARGVTPNNGSVYFDGRGFMWIPLYESSRFTSGLTVSVTIKENVDYLTPQGLVSNCGSDVTPSFSISLDPRSHVVKFSVVVMTMTSPYPFQEKLEVRIPYTPGVQKTIEMQCDGQKLIGRVNNHVSGTHVPSKESYELSSRPKPLYIGKGCVEDSLDNFYGDLNSVTVYRCVRSELGQLLTHR